MKAVHQFVSTLSPYDAVSNSIILCQKLLRQLGYKSTIYVQYINSKLDVEQKRYSSINHSADEMLLIHHCMGSDLEKWFIKLINPKMLVYHNITPTNFFKPSDPNYQNSILGRKQLKTFLPHMLGAIAISEYNANELFEAGYQKVQTIPLLFTLEELQNQPVDDIINAAKIKNGYLLIHIGRLARNKCIHDIIDSYAQLLYLLDQPSNLVFIGKAADDIYLKELIEQCETLGISKQVRFVGPLADPIKKAFLQHANAYLCLSEHEGFCVPLIEAAVNGVPVIAYDSSNIRNTLNNGGIILADKDPKKIAACLSVLNKNAELKNLVVAEQYKSMEKYKEANLLAQLKSSIEMATRNSATV